ncbi:MAG: alginate export family protein [Planctomycetota bacterium]|jgi:hypothetical protein
MTISSLLAILAFIGSFAAEAEPVLALPAAVPATGGEDTRSEQPGDAASDEEKRLAAQFKNLRFQEDWDALLDPEVETDHWYPAAKAVEIGEEGDWTASFGGQIRWQGKSEKNRSLTGSLPGSNSFHLLRLRLHGDLRLRDDFRVFVETLHASIRGNEAAPAGIDRNQFDVQNAFVEFMGEQSRVRLGRTEMQYGAQRLISPLDWGNTRRTFQGGVFQVVNGDLTTDVFAVHPVIVDKMHSDDVDRSRGFFGVYNTYALGPGSGVDGYLLLLDEDDDLFMPAPAGPLGDMELYTYGARAWGKQDGTDWEAEAARQFGDYAGARIRATALTLRAGQTFDDCAGTPRVGLDIDWASGDDDNTDSTRGTFNQLYPLGHAYFGYLDLVGRQNILQIMPNVVWKTSTTTSFRVSYSDFELADRNDFLYNAGGGASSPASALGTSKDVGHEVDLTLSWRPPCMAPHGVWLFGYSEFDPGTFVKGYGDGERARLAYVQYTFTF